MTYRAQTIDSAGVYYAQALELRYRVLREPLGMTRDRVPVAGEESLLHVVAIEGDRVIGTVSLGGERLRQMAVDPGWQGQGVGRALVVALEAEARRRGVLRIELHARMTAVGFYERLGYRAIGEGFTEVGIPHQAMEKQL